VRFFPLTALKFSEEEAEYLASQKLARIATVSRDGSPHVVPVTYEFDGESLYFSGWNLKESLKFRNIQQNGRVAVVIDDLAGGTRWSPRGIELRGSAEIMEDQGGVYVKVKPVRKSAWGLERSEEEREK